MQKKLSRAYVAMIGRYIVSGLSGVIANLIVFTYLYEVMQVWYITAAGLSFIAAYVVTFTFHKFWTFKEKNLKRTPWQGLLYLISALVVLLFTTIQLHLFITYLHMYPVLAQFIALGMGAVASFFFTSLVTFHHSDDRTRRLGSFFLAPWRQYGHRHRFWLVALLIVMVGVVLVRFSFFPLFVSTDTMTYVETARFIAGEEDAQFFGERYLKPLAPGLLHITKYGVGGDLYDALLLESLIGYIALGLAAYWFGWSLFRQRSQAFVLALLTVTSYPMFRYGLEYYTETGIWAFYFATLGFVAAYLHTPRRRYIWLGALTVLGGLLWKEYILLAGIIFALAVIFHRHTTMQQKARHLIEAIALVCIPWGMWQYAVYAAHGYTYMDWLEIGSAPSAYASEYTIRNVVKSVFAVQLLAWGLSVLGLLRLGRQTTIIKQFFYYALIPSFGFLLWGYVSSRLFFSLAPLLLVLAVVGAWQIPSAKLRALLILLVLVGNSILILTVFPPQIQSWVYHLFAL